MKVQKWGNSLGVRIPAPFAKQLNIEEGTEVELILEGEHILIRHAEPKQTLDQLLDEIEAEKTQQKLD